MVFNLNADTYSVFQTRSAWRQTKEDREAVDLHCLTCSPQPHMSSLVTTSLSKSKSLPNCNSKVKDEILVHLNTQFHFPFHLHPPPPSHVRLQVISSPLASLKYQPHAKRIPKSKFSQLDWQFSSAPTWSSSRFSSTGVLHL